MRAFAAVFGGGRSPQREGDAENARDRSDFRAQKRLPMIMSRRGRSHGMDTS
jgi:hypothetical protein